MAKEKREKREKKRSRLRSKLRFSIFNDTSHEEIFHLRSNGLMVLIALILTIILLIGSVTILISFTPLREFIPGYPNAHTRNEIIQNAIKADSLENLIELWDFHLDNIQRVISGKEPLTAQQIELSPSSSDSLFTELTESERREKDSLLREVVLKEEQLNFSIEGTKIEQIEGLHFFPPVKGVVSNGFSNAANHPFIDIAAVENSPVSAVLDGTIVLATFTDETGYTIQIQHDNNLISLYKHNSKLLKKSGEKVKAGTVIALVGNSGSLTSGPHLHFELWHKGVPIDPQKYIKF